jgi:hypothetical protein
MAGLTPRPPGEEARETLAAVLEDQAERERRRQRAGTESKDRSRIADMAAVPLAALTLWFVIAPPSILRPPLVPAPTLEDVQNGLHMDIYIVAAQVIGYRDANGQLPGSLIEALADPEAAEGLTYRPSPDGTFEIAGERAGRVVVYTSTEPLTQFVASARSAVREGAGS